MRKLDFGNNARDSPLKSEMMALTSDNQEAKSEEEKPPLEMEWRRDGLSWLWHSAEGEFVIAPAQIGGAAYFQLSYEG